MSVKKMVVVCLVLLLGAAFSPLFAATPVMVEKNLFSEDRKPPSPESGSTSSQGAGKGMAIGDIQLDGVVFRNDARSAVLRLKNVPLRPPGVQGSSVSPFVTVHVGEMVNEYRVAKIEIQRVTLERNGQTYTIGLFSANKVAAPVSPAPPAAAGSPSTAGTGPGRMQGAPVKNSGLPRGAVFQRGFKPGSPQQPPGARVPMPPNRGPAAYGAPVSGAIASQRAN